MFKFIGPSVQEFNSRFARYKAWVPIIGPRPGVLFFQYSILSTGRCPFGASVQNVLACGLRHRTRSAWGSGGGPGGLQEAPYLADMISDASVSPQHRLSASPLAIVSGNMTKWNVMDTLCVEFNETRSFLMRGMSVGWAVEVRALIGAKPRQPERPR